MKAIVANVLYGSILGCLSLTNSASANPSIAQLTTSDRLDSSIPSTPLVPPEELPVAPQIINLVDRVFTVNKSEDFDLSVDREAQIIFRDRFRFNGTGDRDLKLDKSPYTHRDRETDLILGFQKTFWPKEKKGKYWGITTIEHWGEEEGQKVKFNLAKLNYADSAPTLSPGNSTFTFSGGGSENLAKKTDTSKEFNGFRGGFTYHHGVFNDVTMGVGLYYEESWVSFTQLTYKSDFLPLKTTISVFNKKSDLDVRSHISLKPAENIVLNYYHDREKERFDASWGLIPGLTLTAKSNSKEEIFSTGIKVAVRNEYMSISANAALDSNNNLQWNVKSEIAGLKFAHSSKGQKTDSEVNLDLIDSQTSGFQVSAFVKYKTRIVEEEQENFTVWGSKLQSGEKISANRHLWSLNLGYGVGSLGEGLVASGAFALQPNLFLNLKYQGISATSDETKVKLQLSSQ